MSRRPDFNSHSPHAPPLKRHPKPSPPSSADSPPAATYRSSDGNSTTSHQSQNNASMDDDDVARSPQPTPPPAPPARTPSFPVREDCWSEDATFTLIEAWGDRYLELNRGNLRQKHWQEVADAVNARHGHIKKARRTDVQCKNRIDTLKKKYKVEKSKVLELGADNYVSPWPFFAPLDSLIGTSFKPSSHTPSPSPTPVPYRKRVLSPPRLPPPPTSVPVGPRSKRPAPAVAHHPPNDSSYFRRNFSAIAAAAAAAAEEESDTSRSSGGNRLRPRRPEKDVDSGLNAYCQLAEAIGMFAQVYERVEEAKQRQMVELEKQRMQFTKDLELQRMKLLMESQVQLERLKHSKQNVESDVYRCNDGDHSASIS